MTTEIYQAEIFNTAMKSRPNYRLKGPYYQEEKVLSR